MKSVSECHMWLSLVNSARRSAASWTLTGALLGALSMTGCGPTPPIHGTEFVIAIDAGTTGDATNSLQSLSRTRKVLQRRLAKMGIQSVVNQQEDGRLLIKIAQLNTNELIMVRQMIARPACLSSAWWTRTATRTSRMARSSPATKCCGSSSVCATAGNASKRSRSGNGPK